MLSLKARVYGGKAVQVADAVTFSEWCESENLSQSLTISHKMWQAAAAAACVLHLCGLQCWKYHRHARFLLFVVPFAASQQTELARRGTHGAGLQMASAMSCSAAEWRAPSLRSVNSTAVVYVVSGVMAITQPACVFMLPALAVAAAAAPCPRPGRSLPTPA